MSRHSATPTRAWRAVRLRVLEAAGFRCQACGRPGRLEVDHIRPLHRGGAALDVANLQALCRTCHIAKTKAENSRRQVVDGQAAWRDRLAKHAGLR